MIEQEGVIIGVTGKARSGKDTVGEHLVEYYGFVQFAFADAVKDAASVIFRRPRPTFYEGDREKMDPYWKISPREMLQKLGTEACREVFGEDVWVKRMKLELEQDFGGFAVITDVRFENEAAMIRDMGGQVWQLERPGVKKVGVTGHSSEAGIKPAPGDVVIRNDKDEERLKDNIGIHVRNFLRAKGVTV